MSFLTRVFARAPAPAVRCSLRSATVATATAVAPRSLALRAAPLACMHTSAAWAQAQAAPAAPAATVKTSTNITGLDVVPNGREVLMGLYKETLASIEQYNKTHGVRQTGREQRQQAATAPGRDWDRQPDATGIQNRSASVSLLRAVHLTSVVCYVFPSCSACVGAPRVQFEPLYNDGVRRLTQHRLTICEQEEDVDQIEKRIWFGQIEELIEMAEDELDLLVAMNGQKGEHTNGTG